VVWWKICQQSAAERHQIYEHFRLRYLPSSARTSCRYFMDKWNKGRSDSCLDMTFVNPSVTELCIVFNPLVLELSVAYSEKDQDLNGHPLLCVFLANDFRWHSVFTVALCTLIEVTFWCRRVNFLSVYWSLVMTNCRFVFWFKILNFYIFVGFHL
jgi:hypothetical protein